MENRLVELLQTLQKLLSAYRGLSDLLRQEREAIAEAKLSTIQECVFGKEAALEAIRQRELERVRLVGDIAFALKIPAKNLTLTQLVIEIQGKFPKAAESLRSVQVALMRLTQKAHEQNQYNRGLLEKSLEHFHRMKRNVLGEAGQKSATYSPTGQSRAATGAPRLLSTEI